MILPVRHGLWNKVLELERRPHTNNVSFALLELEDPLQQYEVPAPKPVLFNLI